jgi:hypothetical protein
MHAVKDDYDPNQMGGDFVIDAAGVVRLAYYSATNTDRPTPTAHTRTDDRCGHWAEAGIIAASHVFSMRTLLTCTVVVLPRQVWRRGWPPPW